MAIYQVACTVTIEAENAHDASDNVWDVLTHAVTNYDGFLSCSVDLGKDMELEDEE